MHPNLFRLAYLLVTLLSRLTGKKTKHTHTQCANLHEAPVEIGVDPTAGSSACSAELVR